MPRDPGLEELVKSSLGNTRVLSEKAMFGGWAWLLHGNLLCGARRGSLLLRVGKDNEAWTNEIPGVATAIMSGRRMSGWVRALPRPTATTRSVKNSSTQPCTSPAHFPKRASSNSTKAARTNPISNASLVASPSTLAHGRIAS
jgi:hypothetical protein